MSHFKTLQLAIDLALSKRDQALAELQKQRYALAFAHDQMNQLQQYSDETEQRWLTRAQISTTPELLLHHGQFMARLHQAIDLQQGVLLGAEQREHGAQQDLLKAELHMASLKLLMDKRRAQANQLVQRREQKQMDEFAAMQTLRQQRQILENQP
ncbi:flagellar export protein FliJ [Rhodoferax sp.]|uniref:flagellar export protein FliJ n=1 Tax=Rhodoferax sp. TaxID=50421 RepID=UPI00262DF1B6|nr:flagellar export protein FliJ [Rhodoferax sp.]MDD4942169.1 flagellar export protein FliJ [Rhodoferax sp.]MDD5478257.1 flagellar export protein FliJ [Rhodoferax sp.]